MSCLYGIIILLFPFSCLCYGLSPNESNLIFNSTMDIVLNVDEDDIDTICSARKCIPKCCPKNENVIQLEDYSLLCIAYDAGGRLQFSNVSLYDDNVHNQKVDKTLSEIFLLTPNKLADENFVVGFPLMATDPNIGMRNYLSLSGVLWLELPNAYNRWISVEKEFCVDYYLNKTTPELQFWSVIPMKTIAKSNSYYTAGLILSSCFLTLVLLVYAVLPDLQNLAGMVLMAYVFSLLAAFTSLAVMQIGLFLPGACVALTSIIYFFLLSSFCWMNVMSCDIWWTFRGYAKARPIHRRGEKFKFLTYCLYGWGVPFLMTVALIVLNEVDLSDIPWFVTPQVPKLGCLIEEGQKLLYLYVPMLIMIVFNWMFFLMTSFNIWRLSRGTDILHSAAAGNASAHQSQKNRFIVYLKVSLIMGINWLLEVVSSFAPELHILWYITDAYNILIGLAIFFIFVFKKKIYNKLKLRYYNIRFPRGKLTKSNTGSTIESSISQESQSMSKTGPVSSDPRGISHMRLKNI